MAQELPLPPRPASASTGREFLAKVSPLSLDARENQAVAQVLAGNVPDFLRRLHAVSITNVNERGTNVATFYTTPDYLAIGSDGDYALMPLSPQAAQRIADATDCSLPTRKMVDEIYKTAELKLPPSPIPPSPEMTSVVVFSNHNETIWSQRVSQLQAHPLGALVAGHKKDIVISAQLLNEPEKVAIYGWHQTNGEPIQRLYLGHAARWVDYSQCARLVQQRLAITGSAAPPKTIAQLLADPTWCGLLSDEGIVRSARYPTNTRATVQTNSIPASAATFQEQAPSGERITSFQLEPEVKIHINAPPLQDLATRKLLLIFYALPNGNSTAQTIGKTMRPGDDWHYNIQHIGAQTRFLRHTLTNRAVVVAYLESTQKSWPAWRKKHGDQSIPGILEAVEHIFGTRPIEKVLASHSGGGSFIFGYLNTVTNIPEQIVRIVFLDSTYGYDSSLGHRKKLTRWLVSPRHYLCVLAYDDASALSDGKPFVSASGGTWGKSHEMQRDLAMGIPFASITNGGFEFYSSLDFRAQFNLMQNPERKVFHTILVERNGFIHSILSGTPDAGRGYEYFGPRAYEKWIQERAEF